MSYRQPNDPYYHSRVPIVYPDYPTVMDTGHIQRHDLEPDWEGKSYEASMYGGSQVHLNPQYEKFDTGQQPSTPAFYINPNYPPTSIRPPMPHPQSSAGYTDARERLMRRRSVRHIELRDGNLVLDVKVPTHIVPKGMDHREEMTTMRYTAATCDPNDFVRSQYTLRPSLYGRKTELFIVMTMYNEDEILFTKTMNAVLKNIAHLCGRDRSRTWGANAWEKVVVCIVSDGRSKVNKRTLQVLNLMGCYQEGIAKDEVNGKDVTAHIFEYTSSVICTATGETSTGPCPVQIIFCLKEQNKKKLNSHRWFFNAFGPLIKPEVCILLDVGTKPTGTSIYELWKCFDKHPGVGGACGEICVDTGRGCSLLLTSPLAASQNFEYKMSNILDKPLESVFGYISVLPGAFSAYRYAAVKGQPLTSYFKGEAMHGGSSDAGIFERNMYLAEDRILCFEIVTKKKEAWTLRYVKSAKASTDVPTTVPEFISQRRRWLNGSLFASLHATVFFFRIWTSGQGILRMIILQFEFIYNAIQLVFTWTALANFYLAFYFLVTTATTASNDAFNFISQGAGKIVFEVFLKLYIGLLFFVLVCSLGNRPQGSKWMYTLAMVLFGICNIITLWCAGYTVYLSVPHTVAGWKNISNLLQDSATFRDIVISLAATYGLYLISSFMHFEPWHMFTCFIQYMFLLPSYVNILMTYSMSNLHDVSWGTKGDNGAAKDLGGATKVKDKDGKDVMAVELPTAQEDVDHLWSASKISLGHKALEQKTHRDAATKQADRDRSSRTNVILAWVGTNMFMILTFTSTEFLKFINTHFASTKGSTFNPYLTFLFYALAGLSAIRFLGSLAYLILRFFGQ